MSDLRLQKMGFVFQQAHLLKKLSVRDNIVLPGLKAGRLARDQVRQKAEALLAEMGIANVAGSDITKISGGQLQRAAICRALINQPDIVFGDEPTGALNSSAAKDVMDIINTVNGAGTTVILVTHDAKVAARADRVIFLADGHIRAELALGKYQPAEADQTCREKRLSQWLQAQGI